MPQRLKIHLDTDLGGDTDDLCALALLLASPDVDIVGITTVTDTGGKRAALVRHVLKLAGREEIPVASGAFGVLRGYPTAPEVQGERYWPDLDDSPATSAGSAIDLLLANAAAGATVVAIGPFTNLAVAETLRPGAFQDAPVVVMGGFVRPIPPGFPQWDAAMDYNVQADAGAARIVFERLSPVIVPIEVTVRTWVTLSDLPRLEAGGPVPKLIARQSALHAEDWQMDKLATVHPGLPDDMLNFQHDPLACAVAMGWECVRREHVSLVVTKREGSLRLVEDPAGRPFELVTSVDSQAFTRRWLDVVAPEQARLPVA